MSNENYQQQELFQSRPHDSTPVSLPRLVEMSLRAQLEEAQAHLVASEAELLEEQQAVVVRRAEVANLREVVKQFSAALGL